MDAFKDLKRRRNQRKEDKIENMMESLFCSNNVSGSCVDEIEAEEELADLIIPPKEMTTHLRKRKGSTLIDILNRPTKIKRRRVRYFFGHFFAFFGNFAFLTCLHF